MKTILRSVIVVAMLALFLLGAASRAAADPAGDTAANGLPATCTFQTLAPGASIWYQIPYRFDYRDQITLDSNGVGGLKFDVYPSVQATSPTGSGSINLNEPTHAFNWEGRLQQNGAYYVLITNTNAFPVQYRVCMTEKEPFYPPPMELILASPVPLAPPASPAPPDCGRHCPAGSQESGG